VPPRAAVVMSPATGRAVLLASAALVLAACSSLARNPVPPELTSVAVIPGLPDARAWAGSPSAAMERDFALSFQQESPLDFPIGADGTVRYPHLAISGGGANGAFGAGFLKGWSATGSRPVFKLVTGVSTGALMAPFAFLGPDYDDELRTFYTTTTSGNIFVRGSFIRQLLSGESLADTAPLAALIARNVDAELLRSVAAAHAGGRRLYIGTADLDSQQFVVWNMGLIAASGAPGVLELFRKVMLASASIPIAFPPVFFEVEAGGRRYDEMHVDGAIGANVFLTAGLFRPMSLRGAAARGSGRDDVFIVHNGQLRAAPSATPRTLRGIALRSLEASARSGMIDDLVRLYVFALREQAHFQWIGIAEGVTPAGSANFDPEAMGRLFEIGYQEALAGPEWQTLPPGLQGVEEPAP
jgi:predicted acylesterase/phospholipase RssA